MEFQGLSLIGQKRPMDGAQFHTPRVGNADGGLIRNRVSIGPGFEQFARRCSEDCVNQFRKLAGEFASGSFIARRLASPVDD
jgi:hypothetical protein